MYKGPFQTRITARCPFCGVVTPKEFDPVVSQIGVVKIETYPEIRCTSCRKVAFKEEKMEIPSPEAIEPKEVLK